MPPTLIIIEDVDIWTCLPGAGCRSDLLVIQSELKAALDGQYTEKNVSNWGIQIDKVASFC